MTCAASYGMFFSAAFKNVADALAPICMMPIILFGGFFANSGTYPDYITWIQYISPIRYALEALVWNEFDEKSYLNNYDMMDRLGFSLGKWYCILYLAILAIGF